MRSRLRQLAARVRALFDGSQFDHNLDAELECHTSMMADEFVRRGVPPAEAERRARIELGPRAQLREAHRETRSLAFLEVFLKDLRYTFRTFRREKGFATFAILIIGLGIGGGSTIFSIINTLLLRPLPFRDPSTLVWVSNDGKENDLSGQTVPVNPFLDLRNQSRTLSNLAAYYAFYGNGDQKLVGQGEPERLTAVPVSVGFFPLLGIQPQLGRLFTEDECQKNSAVVLLSAGLWKRRFGSDPAIYGKQLTLNDRSYTVIGVMPASFDFTSVFAPGHRVDMFLPLPLTPAINRRGNTLSLIGRLRPGVSVQQVQAEFDVLSEPIRVRHDRNELRFKVSPLEQHVSGRLRPALLVLAAAVGVLMLIVCANLSNLQLARAAAREKEMAVRAALGAGRARLIQQMLTESVVLSLCGALLGLFLATVGTRVLAALDTVVIPLRQSIQFDAVAFTFTMVIAVVSGLVFGMAPALRAPALAVHDSLKNSGRALSGARRHNWIRASLVVSEIAFACVLLVCAGLLIRSFLQVLDVDLGFQPERAASLRIDPSSQYSTQAKRNAYYDEVLRLVRATPGIDAAGLSDVLPLGQNRSWSAGAKEQVYSPSHPPPDAFVRVVTDGYFAAMGIPLRAGREFTERDNVASKRVIIINETLARALWPDRDPIGQIVQYVDVEREVVGVVGDVRHMALEKGAGCEFYLPMRQTNDYSSVELVLRSALPSSALASAVRASLKPVEPNLPAHELRLLQELVDKSLSPRRFVVLLLGGFSAFALALASLGIYGVVSYSVTQRSQEIGIRMALGASAGDMQRRILFETLALVTAGIAIGVTASWVAARIIDGLLFGVKPTDPLTFLTMLAVLGLVALAAGYFPARRASRIDPMACLRSI